MARHSARSFCYNCRWASDFTPQTRSCLSITWRTRSPVLLSLLQLLQRLTCTSMTPGIYPVSIPSKPGFIYIYILTFLDCLNSRLINFRSKENWNRKGFSYFFLNYIPREPLCFSHGVYMCWLDFSEGFFWRARVVFLQPQGPKISQRVAPQQIRRLWLLESHGNREAHLCHVGNHVVADSGREESPGVFQGKASKGPENQLDHARIPPHWNHANEQKAISARKNCCF